MKKFGISLLLLSLFGCSVQYDSETRLVYNVKLTDSQGNPAANVAVRIRPDDIYSTETISLGNTNESGELTLIFPAVDRTEPFYSFEFGEESEYLEQTRQALPGSIFDSNYTFSHTISLDRSDSAVNVAVNTVQQNPNHTLVNLQLTGEQPESGRIYSDGTEEIQYYPYFFKNQQLQLSYTVFDEITQTAASYVIEIPLAADDLTYTLNY